MSFVFVTFNTCVNFRSVMWS